ncbi:MAG: QueT transporter family protein [Aigarchaeota archaeon]|nr:QueT transporter family protein [Aigarchaeota archaeon]MCX8192471.1 QueT transporter family protein [Nitrososphaeria archaeon]MDW7985793.1 QueT transporter family protein [Nitrososphaerota archaeon]
MEKKSITLASMFASLYAVLVVALAPVSFLPLQVRFADALIPLSIIYGWTAIIGLTIGCMISNFIAGQVFFGGWTIIDTLGGALANFIACYIGWKICLKHTRRYFITTTSIQSIIISFIVGTYLWYIFGSPEYYNVYTFILPGLPAFWITIFIGSFISIVLLGNILLIAILKSKIYPIEKT